MEPSPLPSPRGEEKSTAGRPPKRPAVAPGGAGGADEARRRGREGEHGLEARATVEGESTGCPPKPVPRGGAVAYLRVRCMEVLLSMLTFMPCMVVFIVTDWSCLRDLRMPAAVSQT